MTHRESHFSRRKFLHAASSVVALGSGGLHAMGAEPPDNVELRFGVVADCQYADVDTVGTRHYRASLGKIQQCVETLNEAHLQFVVHLGDFIDRGFDNLEGLLPVFNQCQVRTYHVLGNHDFSVADEKKADVPGKLDMRSRYYDFSVGRWRFVVLDGNDVSFHGRDKGTEEYRQAEAMLTTLTSRSAPNAVDWNGAIGDTQLAWLATTLDKASTAGQRVTVFCHFPVYPPNAHNLWNDQQVIEILEANPCVVAYLNGHNHAGNYAQKNGIHYLTVEGMVETEDSTAYAIVHVSSESLRIQGFGRVADRSLELRHQGKIMH